MKTSRYKPTQVLQREVTLLLILDKLESESTYTLLFIRRFQVEVSMFNDSALIKIVFPRMIGDYL